METRIDSCVISSRMVESGAKSYKGRFSGLGMRWNRSRAKRLTQVRSAVMLGKFNKLESPPTIHLETETRLLSYKLLTTIRGDI
jgi:hypothetical protein